MPNPIKYSVSSQTLALKTGNYYIGTNDVPKGPTSTTDYWNGITPPGGGYTVYLNKASQGPSIHTCVNDSELVTLTNKIAGASYTTAAQCLSYYLTQSDKMCLNRDYEQITTNGLVLDLDAGFSCSYPRTGSTWSDMSLSGSNSSFGGVTYSSSEGGTFVFDGTDDYIDFVAPNLGGTATVEMWCKIGAGYSGKMFMGWLYYDIYCANGDIGYNTGAGDVYGISASTVNSLGIVNAWAHYVFEFRSDVPYTNNKIYINGVEQSVSQRLSSEAPGNRNFNGGNGRIAVWRGDLNYCMPMSCSVFRVYNRSLTAAEVNQNYQAQKGRYQNFFTNGNFQFLTSGGALQNYTGGIVNTSTVYPGNNYSLQMPQTQYSTFLSDSYVQVDTTKTYRIVAINRTLTKGGPGDNVLSGGHLGFATFDSSFRFIDLRNCGGVANSYLTRTLNPGDSYAYISNQNNQWYPTGGTEWYFRHFCLYPPSHPEYNKPWEYTRIGYGDFDIFYNEITDIGGGELRLRFADAAGNWTTFPNIGYATPTNTPVMNGVAGGTFNYVFYPAEGAFGSWTTHTSPNFTGENRNSHYPFRYATKYVLFMHLINYAVPGGTSPLPVMLFGDVRLEEVLP